MAPSKLIIPIEIQQLADWQQHIVDQNNGLKIFNYNESVKQAADYTSKGLPIPAGYEPKPPILTSFDHDKYMTLYLQDDAEWRGGDGQGIPGEHTLVNLNDCYAFYSYVPPVVPVAGEVPQPKNPLGTLVDDDLGIFGRAPGDKYPVGHKFTLLGTDFVLTSFGGQLGKRLLWVRQG